MDPAKAGVERLFHRRVRQVEPLLQKIDAQHTFDPDRRAAIAGDGMLLPLRFGVGLFLTGRYEAVAQQWACRVVIASAGPEPYSASLPSTISAERP